MSRSYKKSKVIKVGKNKYLKNFANRKLRKNENISDGSNYKKHFESWDICDARFYVTRDIDKESIWNNPKWFRK